MLSSRYATAVLVALGCALVPTVINSYWGRQLVERPALRDAVPETLAGVSSTLTTRRASTIKREFESEDWVERQYVDASGRRVVLLAVRSYDMKRLYHHPELAVTEAKFDPEHVVQVPSPAGPLDVHILRSSDGRGDLAAYLLLYRDRTVSNPFVFQMRVAPELLFLGRRPLTLLFAQTTGSGNPRDEEALQQLLAAAATAVRAEATASSANDERSMHGADAPQS